MGKTARANPAARQPVYPDMLYFLQNPDGSGWKIEDADRSNRWTLHYRRANRWQKVTSYTSPAAAALAVAGGDTGIHEWDDRPRNSGDFVLSRWRREDGPLAESA